MGPPVQAGAAPHRQVPFPPQVSAVEGLQARQPPPPAPQSESVVGVTHTPLLQQVAQLPGWHVEQAPASQVPAPHPAQTAPPVPQAVPELPGMH